MSERTLNPQRGRLVAAWLKDLSVRGVLITAAQQGYVLNLACQMAECLCPEELGGRLYFEEVTRQLPDWMPTADHFPQLKMYGGRRTVGNVRLAHRLCNRIDYSKQVGRSHVKDLARVEAARTKATEGSSRSSPFTVLVWNMALGSLRPPGRQATWNDLLQIMEKHSVHVALLNEVRTSLLNGIDDLVFEPCGTRGRDRKRRDWCAAIFSPRRPTHSVASRRHGPLGGTAA